jgi:hypothetical protein
MRRVAAGVACLCLVAGALSPTSGVQGLTGDGHPTRQQADPDSWQRFAGSWNATGQRQSLPTESGRHATILSLSGAVVLTGAAGLGRGFRSEVIGFYDGGTRSVGRWVWTDDRGDRIFGTLTGDPVQTGRRVDGTITGGSGRYAGIVGEFSFTWQYVVNAEDGIVQGRSSGLEGRFRRGTPQP